MARINMLAIWYHEKLGFQPGALRKLLLFTNTPYLPVPFALITNNFELSPECTKTVES